MNQPGFRLYRAIITVLGRTALIHKKEGRFPAAFHRLLPHFYTSNL
jgi:hypothetical protein